MFLWMVEERGVCRYLFLKTMIKSEIKIIPVKRFENSFEANLLKCKLESEGIESFLTNENLATLIPNYSNMLDMRIELMVSENDYERALNIVNDHKVDNLTDKICPNCNSTNILRKYGKYNFPKWLVFIMSLIAYLPLVHTKYTLVCKDCNTEFARN